MQLPRATAIAHIAVALLVTLAAVALGHGLAQANHRAAGTIDTFAGAGALNIDDIAATDASIPFPFGIAVNATSDVFIADAHHCAVRKVTGGWISTVAGNGTCGYSGDGGPATEASLNNRTAIAVDAIGNLYIGDFGNCSVRRVDVASGVISTIAGGDCGGRLDDGDPAIGAWIGAPLALAIHPNGDVYFADTMNCRVRRISAGIVRDVAGQQHAESCKFSGDGGPASASHLNGPMGLAIDAAGDLYIADGNNCRIRKVSGGIINTIAGTGHCYYNGDGPALSTSLNTPLGIAIDREGGLLIADADNCLIRRLHNGTITTVAGSQFAPEETVFYTECGYNGDDRPALGAMIGMAIGIASDADGNVYFSEIEFPGNGGKSRVRVVYGEAPPDGELATATPLSTVTWQPADPPSVTETPTLSPAPTGMPTTLATPTPSPTPEGPTRVVVCHWVPSAPGDSGELPGPDGGSYRVIIVDDDGADGNAALRAHEHHEHDIIGSNEICGIGGEPVKAAALDSSSGLGFLLAVAGSLGFGWAVKLKPWRSRRG